ncbi:MAG: PaaI family thioesterase [Candidatus Omnitrophica bacterium]|nr:PaaI family thioesterase [Candidatus Omnitrophota bacterium]
MKLEDDRFCFVCGSLNDSGLKLSFKLDEKNKTISTEFVPQKIHQGYKDIVHGGLIGLVLDETMVNLPWKLGKPAVSAEYTVRLLNPAAIGKKLTFTSRIISEKGRLLMIEGKCLDEDDQKIATSSSKCMKINSVK